MIEDLHDDEGAQHVAEQSHAQRQGTGEDVQDVERSDDGCGLNEGVQPPAGALGPDAGDLHQNNAHHGQGAGDDQTLRGGLEAEHADDVGKAEVEQHGDQVGDIGLSALADNVADHALQLRHDELCGGLPLGDVIHLQVAAQDDAQQDDDCHDHPADCGGFRDTDALPDGNGEYGIIDQFFLQKICKTHL